MAMTGRYVDQDTDPLRELSDKVESRIAASLFGSIGADDVPLCGKSRSKSWSESAMSSLGQQVRKPDLDQIVFKRLITAS